MKNAASQLLRMKKSGESLDAQRIIQALHDFIIVEKNNSHGEKREKKYGDGVVAKYGKNFT
ncbi:chromosome partitioning protein ParB, partial [Escherichia coli]|nr:chromosome partitioning protein ParB [Escherichia coli]